MLHFLITFESFYITKTIFMKNIYFFVVVVICFTDSQLPISYFRIFDFHSSYCSCSYPFAFIREKKSREKRSFFVSVVLILLSTVDCVYQFFQTVSLDFKEKDCYLELFEETFFYFSWHYFSINFYTLYISTNILLLFYLSTF